MLVASQYLLTQHSAVDLVYLFKAIRHGLNYLNACGLISVHVYGVVKMTNQQLYCSFFPRKSAELKSRCIFVLSSLCPIFFFLGIALRKCTWAFIFTFGCVIFDYYCRHLIGRNVTVPHICALCFVVR